MLYLLSFLQGWIFSKPVLVTLLQAAVCNLIILLFYPTLIPQS